VTKSLTLARAAWWLVVSAVIAVPLVIGFHGSESFRAPKDAAFILFGLVLAVCVIACGTLRQASNATWIALAAVAWTAIATAFSANRAISLRTLVWVAAAAAFAIAVDVFGRNRSHLVIAVPLITASINAVVFLLQRFHVWNPMRFPDDVPDHFRFTALIGNPDDVGSFFVAPAIVAVALAISDRKRRAIWIPAAALLTLCLATGRLTSIIAFGAGLLTIGFLRSRRAAIAATVLVIAGGIALVTAYAPMRERAQAIAAAVKANDYAEASAGRVTPFLAAAEMAKDHPLFGVGPGCFGFEYFPYKIAVERAHPHLQKAFSATFNYAETHNDHLQTLAETGVIGLVILLAAIVVVGRSGAIGLAIAVSIAVLCLAHFPLHLSASTIVLLYVGALSVSWSERGGEDAAEPAAGTAALLGAGVAAIAAFFLIVRFAWAPANCNEQKPAIVAATRDAADVIVDRIRSVEVARANLARIDACVAADPTDVDFYMLAAANNHVLQRDDDAVALYREALSWSRRPEIYYELGMLELRMNRRAEAMADLLQAARFNRSYVDDLPADVRNEITSSLR